MRGRGRPFWKRVLPLPLKLPLPFPKTFIMAPDGHQRRRNRAGRPVPRQHRNAPYQDDTGRFYAIQRNIWTKRETCAGPIQPCGTMSAIQRRRPAIQTRRKVFSGWGRAREGEGQFLPKNAPPPLVIIPLKAIAYFKPRSRSRLLTAIWPMVATAPLVEDEQWEPMTRLSRAYQRASCGGSCSNTSRPAP